jgi:hypothetical protein
MPESEGGLITTGQFSRDGVPGSDRPDPRRYSSVVDNFLDFVGLIFRNPDKIQDFRRPQPRARPF